MESSGDTSNISTAPSSQDVEITPAEANTIDFKIETTDEEKIKQAEEFKNIGNEFFKNGKYQDAYDAYTKAIDLNIGGSKQCIYFSNRAFTSLKLENYGIAITDANASIEIDPKYIKAYYRRGSAFFALNHLKDAIKDFKKVNKLVPADKDAKNKLDAAQKLKTELDFAMWIAVEEKK